MIDIGVGVGSIWSAVIITIRIKRVGAELALLSVR